MVKETFHNFSDNILLGFKVKISHFWQDLQDQNAQKFWFYFGSGFPGPNPSYFTF